jgi:hypothetical protein
MFTPPIHLITNVHFNLDLAHPAHTPYHLSTLMTSTLPRFCDIDIDSDLDDPYAEEVFLL